MIFNSEILTRGDARLALQAEPVQRPDSDLDAEIGALRHALNKFRDTYGFGRAIAAPQLGISKRLIYLHLDSGPHVLTNAEITWRSEQKFAVWDDCLSVPDLTVQVERHQSISLRFQTADGAAQTWQHVAPDLSELLQHELDHLDGILMTDRAIDADAMQPIAMRNQLLSAEVWPSSASTTAITQSSDKP